MLPQRNVGESPRQVGSHVVRVDSDESAEVPDCPLVPAQAHLGSPPVVQQASVEGGKVNDPGVVRYRKLVLLQAGVGQPPGCEVLAVVGPVIQGPIEVPDRLVVSAHGAEGDAPASQRDGAVRFNPYDGIEVPQGGLEFSSSPMAASKPQMAQSGSPKSRYTIPRW